MKLKQAIKDVDRELLGGFIQSKSFNSKHTAVVEDLRVDFPYQKSIYYSHKPMNLISILCDKYGSDKGSEMQKSSSYRWHAHTYADLYFDLFHHCRQHIRAVFECGLGTNNEKFTSNMGVAGKPGASLRVWQEYFPNAVVVGADIDQDVLFNEDRISTHHVDQTDRASVQSMWERVGDIKFDLFVDDGLHTFDAGITLFEESIAHLSSNGVYVIEDIRIEDTSKFHKYFRNKKYSVQFVNLLRPNIQLDDNSMILIRKMGEE